MTKAEFINHLETRLSVLNKKEREDIEQEYSQHIDNKLSEGMTEAQAVASLGDIDAFTDEILMAYNIDPNYDNISDRPEKHKPLHRFKKYINTEKIKSVISSFFRMENVIRLVKIGAFILIAIVVFAVGLDFAISIGGIMASNLPEFLCIDDLAGAFFVFSYVLIYVTAVVSIGYGIIKRNIPKLGLNIPKLNLNKIKEVSPMKTENNKFFTGSAGRVIIFIIKLYIFFAVVIPCGIVFMLALAAMGALLVAFSAGYPVIGLSISCLGFNIFLAAFLAVLIKLLYVKKKGADNIEESIG